MTRLLSLLVIPMLFLSCSKPNPQKVWLALNGSERAVQLVPNQPDPF